LPAAEPPAEALSFRARATSAFKFSKINAM
jgi:hypothetical protein